MAIPTYAQWMTGHQPEHSQAAELAAQGGRRSHRRYEGTRSEKELWGIKNAFEDWKRYKGPAWERSERNTRRGHHPAEPRAAEGRRFADVPDHALFDGGTDGAGARRQGAQAGARRCSGQEGELKAVNKVRNNSWRRGQKVKETSARQAPGWFRAARTSRLLRRSPKAGRPRISCARKCSTWPRRISAWPGSSCWAIWARGAEDSGGMRGGVPPVVGHIKDGYDLFTGWAKVGADMYQQYNISERHYVIDTGVPSPPSAR